MELFKALGPLGDKYKALALEQIKGKNSKLGTNSHGSDFSSPSTITTSNTIKTPRTKLPILSHQYKKTNLKFGQDAEALRKEKQVKFEKDRKEKRQVIMNNNRKIPATLMSEPAPAPKKAGGDASLPGPSSSNANKMSGADTTARKAMLKKWKDEKEKSKKAATSSEFQPTARQKTSGTSKPALSKPLQKSNEALKKPADLVPTRKIATAPPALHKPLKPVFGPSVSPRPPRHVFNFTSKQVGKPNFGQPSRMIPISTKSNDNGTKKGTFFKGVEKSKHSPKKPVSDSLSTAPFKAPEVKDSVVADPKVIDSDFVESGAMDGDFIDREIKDGNVELKVVNGDLIPPEVKDKDITVDEPMDVVVPLARSSASYTIPPSVSTVNNKEAVDIGHATRDKMPGSYESYKPLPRLDLVNYDNCYVEYSDKFMWSCSTILQGVGTWQGTVDDLVAKNLISDEVIGDIKSAIGLARLTVENKLPQFAELLYYYYSKNNVGKPVLPCDLSGWWAVAEITVNDCLSRFEKLKKRMANNWAAEEEGDKTIVKKSGVTGKKKIAIKASKSDSGLKFFLAQKRKKMRGDSGDSTENEENAVPAATDGDKKDNDNTTEKVIENGFVTPPRSPHRRKVLGNISSSGGLKSDNFSPRLVRSATSSCKTPMAMLAVRNSMSHLSKIGKKEAGQWIWQPNGAGQNADGEI